MQDSKFKGNVTVPENHVTTMTETLKPDSTYYLGLILQANLELHKGLKTQDEFLKIKRENMTKAKQAKLLTQLPQQ